ncbi:hypothetical protein ACFQXB_16015 [Plastorhodobacter daqingensis]|uniref:Uncharacterized protein n=1 Tax=Plastorhodobacter daqingensis TaxID=1387281 RepID=A0ABW2UNK7_9RHOB
MSFVRPEVAAVVHRWREVIVAGAVLCAGTWLMGRGGWLLAALGGVALVAGGALLVVALRRLRFQRAVTDPGVVEVLEGQISYMGPETGGWVALSDLAEIAHARDGSGSAWWLRETGGRSLAIPVAAQGAGQLFDVFAALPGMDMQRLLRVLDSTGHGRQSLWLRDAGPALTWRAQGDRSCR